MIELLTRNALRFVFLIFFQVLILNNVQLGGFINPYLYVLFILMLPVETPGWMLLLLAFAIGLGVDLFENTAGMHASASVFMAFCRPYLLNMIAPREGFDRGTKLTIQKFGVPWFLTYAGILIVLHHLALFYLEIFRLSAFFSTLLRVLLSSVFTLGLVVITQFLFNQVKKS
ncbi:MAG: rod shape-determining protein MreD [Bacteroidia bacterium]